MTHPMRLFVASGIFHPEPGGPASYLHRLLPALIDRGVDVTALTFGAGLVEGYPYRLTRIPRRGYFQRQRAYYQAAQRLWPGHDLAYTHSLQLPLPAGVRPRIGKIVGDIAWERATRKKLVPPDTDIDTFQTRRYGMFVEVDKLVRASEARRLDHIIVPSEHRKRMLIGWGIPPERVTVIYNAVDFTPLDLSQAEARRRLDLPEVPLLLTVARLTPLKGVERVLDTLLRWPDVHYVIVGEGDARPELEVQVARLGLAERVRFTGHLAHDEVLPYYRAADYVLLFSGGEGLSHVLLEALSLGTPVIASDKGGNLEVVEHGVNGLLAPYPDVEALAGTLEEALQPGRRDELAAHSRHGLERFGFERMVEQTLDVLRQFAT